MVSNAKNRTKAFKVKEQRFNFSLDERFLASPTWGLAKNLGQPLPGYILWNICFVQKHSHVAATGGNTAKVVEKKTN